MTRLVLLFSVILPAIAPAGCLPVTGDRILARDLAMAEPKFSGLPASLQLAYAPVPGSTRVFAVAELQRIAHAGGLAVEDPSEVCFEVPMHIPTAVEFIEAMRRSLPETTSLQLADMGRSPIPAGKIEFPISGLEPPAAGDSGQLWRGLVQYTDTRRITIWARITASITYTAVVARNDLPADTPIEMAAVQIETKTGPLKREPPATRIEDVVGHVVRRPVRRGAEIPISSLDEPPAVRRGDLVMVEVQSGSAVLHFDAIAQTTVHAGEYADFRNPISGKTFRARAEPGSKALIVVGKGPTL